MRVFQKVACAVSIMGLVFIAQTQQDTAQTGAKCAAPQVTTDPKYSPGQVWSYKTRKGEDASTITILRVETLPKIGTIIHIRIDGITVKNCSGGPTLHTIEHSPFSKDAIDRSVLEIVGQKQNLPDYKNGYLDWRTHCGGVYTIPVAEVVAADEQALNSGTKCQ
jgi:hypothetical protein